MHAPASARPKDPETPEIGGLRRRNGDRARKNEKERNGGVDDGEDIEQEHDPYELRAPGGRLSDCVHRSLPSRSVLPASLVSEADRIRSGHDLTNAGRSSILLYDAEFMRPASAVEEELALACVSSKRRSALELRARLVQAAELGE